MRICIAGAGISGVYLAAMLKKCAVNNDPVDLYDVQEGKIGCSCAWGTETPEFRRYCSYLNIDPDKFIMRNIWSINLQGVWRVATDNFCTINRPAFLKAVLAKYDIRINYEKPDLNKYDRVLDCTGWARAYMPPADGHDVLINSKQVRVKLDSLPVNEATIIFGNIGYGWIFPLDGESYHVGYGELGDPSYLHKWWKKTISGGKIICSCQKHFQQPEKIRLSPPSQMLPLYAIIESGAHRRKHIAVAEAAGAISPVVGEGIIPAFKCADLLLENWDDLHSYHCAVLKEFAWMDKEFEVIENFIDGNNIRGILGFMRVFSNGKRFGMQTSWRDFGHVISVLRTWRKRK